MSTIKIRSTVLVELGGKRRPALVLDISDDGLLVVAVGYTGSHFEEHAHICVEHFRRDGRTLGLSKTTYFYRRNTRTYDINDVSPTRKRLCPPRLWERIYDLCLGDEPDDD